MDEPFDIEIEPEVRLWLMNLSDADYLVAEHVVGLLLDSPTTLGEPYARHLGNGVRELRFDLGHDREAVRISYWLAPGRRIVLLTVFRKTKQREEAQVARAKLAKEHCKAEHGHATDVYIRDTKDGAL
ncbi:addiction module toxin RelE [Streptomyces venezuelae]|uniref:Addiction module toxin RelE n=1 Tax=Streptomyces venezuelae TaxID=54571 RepID=A0A5P2CZM6_STRVZ|nr:type II toxin-antitoxin system RelE/ParE family toxin [Streptomyces venezuelae]QES48352.1 addiction module toxin RelE [Streptomyces venezuelae]